MARVPCTGALGAGIVCSASGLLARQRRPPLPHERPIQLLHHLGPKAVGNLRRRRGLALWYSLNSCHIEVLLRAERSCFLLYDTHTQRNVTPVLTPYLQRETRPKGWGTVPWQQAVEGMSDSREAEDFQAVGVRLRECMVTFASEIADVDLVPSGAEAPKKADVVGWSELLVNHLASGSSGEQLRSYLKKLTRETWDLVNQLTHAKNAGSYDAEIGVAAVSHFISTMTAARVRWSAGPHQRCATCGSYRVGGGTCVRCDWVDPDYEVPDMNVIVDLAERLDSPHTLSSDISTFMSPDDFS